MFELIRNFFRYADINKLLVLQGGTPISVYIERLILVFQVYGVTIEKIGTDSIDFNVPFMEMGNRGSVFQGIYNGKLSFVTEVKSVILNYQISILPIRMLAIGFILSSIIVPVYLFPSWDIEFFPVYLLAVVGALIMAALVYFSGMFFVIWRIEDFLLEAVKQNHKIDSKSYVAP